MTNMNKTYTPELAPEVLLRLRGYAERFQDLFLYPAQFAWSSVYLRGLLEDGERKSIEPMAARVPRPPQLLDIKDPAQALQQFVNQSPWDEQEVAKRYRRVMAESLASPRGIFVIDDTGFPKQGKHSVGVQRQYCGQLGKKANCQVAVTVHYVSPQGHFPAALRLYVPKSWTSAPARLEQAGVPAGDRQERTKGQLAAKFAWVRVWPAQDWAQGRCAGADPIWLLIEERADGKIQYAFSNLPARTRRIQAVRLWKSRWPVEQGYQQMKEELGLNHFEGRSWRGFHHHACLVMLADGFLVLEQLRQREAPASPGKKSETSPRVTVPAIRRA